MKHSINFRAVVGLVAILVGGLGSSDAAVVLDWTEWDSTFIDGRRQWQSYTNSDGVEIRYRNNRVNNTNNPRADFIFGTPAVLSATTGGGAFVPFNGTGGAGDHYLDIYQDAGIGNGTRHRFQFDQGLDGASVEIWDIDSSVLAGRNYSDQVQITAIDGNGSVIQPTRAIVTNTNVVTQTSLNTWTALPNAQSASTSTDGNLVVFFDITDIREIRITYLNADSGLTNSPDSDNQAIGIYNISETGLPPVVPEPSAAVLALFGGVFCLRRRR